MRFEADLHVHSIASGHAFSTVADNVQAAAKKGLKLIAITDHGPQMPDGPHPYYFRNMRVLPKNYLGVEILKGIEANIIDEKGNIDIPEDLAKNLDIVLAGFHPYCSPSGTVVENTRTMIKAINNPLIDMIVHPGNPEFQVDPTEIVLACKEKGTLLEINSSSLGSIGSRAGSYGNCLAIAEKVVEHGLKVAIGSDAHWAEQVGDFSLAVELASKVGLKESQVINTSIQEIYLYLQKKARMMGD